MTTKVLTEEQKAFDAAFLAHLQKPSELGDSMPMSWFDGKRELVIEFEKESTVVQTVKIVPPKGNYSQEMLSKPLAAAFKRKQAITPEMFTPVASEALVYRDGTSPVIMIGKRPATVPESSNKFFLAGTKIILETQDMQVLTDPAEYQAIIDVAGKATMYENRWCRDYLSTKVLDLVPKANEMLEFCRAQVRLLKYIEILAVSPRWLRYFSDGTLDTQTEAIRLAPRTEGGHLSPLIFEGPAWALSLRVYGTALPGRIFVNSTGDFLASDWCMRTTPDSADNGIDLYNGKSSKHTLLSWCAGPALNWIPADKSKEEGFRRARVKTEGSFESTVERNLLLLKMAAHLDGTEPPKVPRSTMGLFMSATVNRNYPKTPTACITAYSAIGPHKVVRIWRFEISWVAGSSEKVPTIFGFQMIEDILGFPANDILIPDEIGMPFIRKPSLLSEFSRKASKYEYSEPVATDPVADDDEESDDE